MPASGLASGKQARDRPKTRAIDRAVSDEGSQTLEYATNLEPNPYDMTIGRGCVLIGVAVSLAGCGARGSAQKPPLIRIARPSAPVWCPLKADGTFDARTILGLPESDAVMTIAKHGCRTRVVEINGHNLTVTADLVPNRVDLSLEREIVTAIDVG
jgi:hypothetical protein